jgi:hypothetical protein
MTIILHTLCTFVDDKDLDVAMDSPGSDNEDAKKLDEDGEPKSSTDNRLVKQEKEVSCSIYCFVMYCSLKRFFQFHNLGVIRIGY